MTRDEIVELMARSIAQSDGLDFDEVCGVDADPDEGYCDSGTCVAAHFEEHDAAYARSIYRHQSTASLRALEAAGCQIVQGWLPIEIAPKDGTWFLAIEAGVHPDTGKAYVPAVVARVMDSWDDQTNDLCEVDLWGLSHWMPLPLPPAGKVQP